MTNQKGCAKEWHSLLFYEISRGYKVLLKLRGFTIHKGITIIVVRRGKFSKKTTK